MLRNNTDSSDSGKKKTAIIVSVCVLAILTGGYFAFFSGSGEPAPLPAKNVESANKLSADSLKNSVPPDTAPPDPAERGIKRKALK